MATTQWYAPKETPPRLARGILLRYLRDHAWAYLLTAALIVGSNFTQIQIPHVLGVFTDNLRTGQLQQGDPIRYAAHLAWLACVYIALLWTATVTIHQLARRFEFHLRNHLFAHWETLSAAYYTYHSVGDLMAHATNDVQAIRQAISGGIRQMMNAAFLITLTVTSMVGRVDLSLALFTLLPLPFLTIFVAVMRPRIKARFRAVQEGFSDLTERTQESISGVRVVKAYAREAHELEKFSEVAQRIVTRTLHLTRASALLNPTVQFVGAISFLISLGFGGLKVIRGELSLGSLVAFNAYLMMLISPIQQIANVIDHMQRASTALGRLSELLAEHPTVTDAPDPVPVKRLRGQITISELSFTYPGTDEPALRQISLSIAPGETLGILGPTGAGKSTLANLLLRVYNPPRGSLFIDGNDILDLPLETLRREIGYVPQDIFLFSASIRENIALGVEQTTEDRIVHAAKQAQLYENILAFPQRFETEIGERGVTLSGGQRQRLALARALIKESPILILDDSLSAVDTETEAAILHGLRALRGRKTTIIIAHRISTIRESDQIIVLDGGRVVQHGNHDTLVAQPGPYQRTYELQRQGTGEDLQAGPSIVNVPQTAKEGDAS